MFFGGSPFEQFGGGMPGGDGGGGGRRGPPPDVDTTELYQILGIEKEASENDIKKAYRKLALKVSKRRARSLFVCRGLPNPLACDPFVSGTWSAACVLPPSGPAVDLLAAICSRLSFGP